MGDKTYFVLAMVFNYWKPAVLIVLLAIGWSDVSACGTKLAEPVVVTCAGCL